MEYIFAVQKMQDYIKAHVMDSNFKTEDVCHFVGYSRRHVQRLFKEYTGKTLKDYINAVRLTQSAYELTETSKNILDIALDSRFHSHEGYTRSFHKRFHVTPSEYRELKIPIPLFIQYPVSHYHNLLKHKEEPVMSKDLNLCMVTPIERPKRKLIYLLSQKGTDYMSYCEEMGCEWEGLLNSIPEKLDSAALIELPKNLTPDGYSNIAAGIEVPLDYQKPIPDSYQIAELPECTMLYFQTESYENEEDFCIAIESAYSAISKYQPAAFGYRFAYDIAPSFNFGAEAAKGAKLAVPAVKL